MDDTTIEYRIAKAANALDTLVPGWHKRVNPEELDMNSCSMCMLGQIFGDDAETAIAKELYPKLHEKYRSTNGFATALWGNTLRKTIYKTGMLTALINQVSTNREESAALEEALFYSSGCFVNSLGSQCAWINEIATRLEKDSNEGTNNP